MSHQKMFDHLDQLKARLDAQRPLPAAVLEKLHEDLLLRWTYHSNAIEGNTLTLLETKVVLEGITVGGKSLREHFEAINHRDAILYLEDIVQRKEIFSEWQIRNIHQLVLKNIDSDNAGHYRTTKVVISGASHRPPDAILLAEKMRCFLDEYHAQAMQLHPVERAAQVHADFVGIHPFIDGNGRTSRLLMNLELMKSGFPPCVIQVDQRLAYYEALDKWHTLNERADFINLVAQSVEAAFEPYWQVISG